MEKTFKKTKIIEPYERLCGIYMIECSANCKRYVGQSKNIHRRWISHLTKCRNEKEWNRQYNDDLYKDMRKYGIESFRFSVLEICKPEELDDNEVKWIELSKALEPNGYNKGKGGKIGKGKLSYQAFDEIVEMLKAGASAKEISAKYGISIQTVTDINVGRYHRIKGMEYPIRKHASFSYECRSIERSRCIDCGKEIYQNCTRCLDCLKASQERKRYGKTGEELKEELGKLVSEGYTRMAIGRKYGVSGNVIRRKLKKYGII